MLLRSGIGFLAGGALGFGYHLLMRALSSPLINRKVPAVPVTLGAIAGAILAAVSLKR